MSLLLKVKPLVISPMLAERIGLNEAIVLQQICYWLEDTNSGVDHEGKRWVYNTIDEWTEQFPFWSTDTVKRSLTSLKKRGLIDVKQLNKKQHDRTNFYSINHANPLLSDEGNLPSSKGATCTNREEQPAPIEKGSLHPSMRASCPVLTENTTESTTEITSTPSCQVASQPDREVVINDSAKKVLTHLNQTTGIKFQFSRSSLENIRGRLAEGYKPAELMLVVDYKHEHWRNTEQAQYLRPATLFIPKNFPGYLLSATKWDKSGRPPCVNGKWQRDVMAVSEVDKETPHGFRGA
ncbi:conserved phage C-terminal domain-containing protein [Candidatus Pantoea bituminis]|uniref:conserved phage C-terminal domain-containing protein n=1 Tax=Candidatus Pantoea bituminis TaxID=2831036 RepID=UPI001C05FD21|nr:conserved phage C-terminal domain-containing protein [Pantoea bituminis]